MRIKKEKPEMKTLLCFCLPATLTLSVLLLIVQL